MLQTPVQVRKYKYKQTNTISWQPWRIPDEVWKIAKDGALVDNASWHSLSHLHLVSFLISKVFRSSKEFFHLVEVAFHGGITCSLLLHRFQAAHSSIFLKPNPVLGIQRVKYRKVIALISIGCLQRPDRNILLAPPLCLPISFPSSPWRRPNQVPREDQNQGRCKSQRWKINGHACPQCSISRLTLKATEEIPSWYGQHSESPHQL